LNQTLTEQRLLSFLQIVDMGYTSSEAISVLLKNRVLSSIVVSEYTDILLTAVRKIDTNITTVETS
jgi:hypothetical protein